MSCCLQLAVQHMHLSLRQIRDAAPPTRRQLLSTQLSKWATVWDEGLLIYQEYETVLYSEERATVAITLLERRDGLLHRRELPPIDALACGHFLVVDCPELPEPLQWTFDGTAIDILAPLRARAMPDGVKAAVEIALRHFLQALGNDVVIVSAPWLASCGAQSDL